jgi:hypothetical protein
LVALTKSKNNNAIFTADDEDLPPIVKKLHHYGEIICIFHPPRRSNWIKMKVLSVAIVSLIYLQSVSQAVRPNFVNEKDGNDYIRTRQLRADETSEASEDAPIVVAPATDAPVTTPDVTTTDGMSMSMSHSMSMSVSTTDDKCHFCMDGMPDPDLVLPTPADGQTCQEASDYAHTLTVDDVMCPTVLAAEAVCCPVGGVTMTDAPVTAPVVTTDAPVAGSVDEVHSTPAPITPAPTEHPTHAPVTPAPTEYPTHAPVTPAPTEHPTLAPVTPAPTEHPTLHPATPAPTEHPFLDAEDDNVCAGAALVFESKLCVDFDVPTPQAGANVTRGYIGQLDVNGILPNTKRFWKSAMCPVNVHW